MADQTRNLFSLHIRLVPLPIAPFATPKKIDVKYGGWIFPLINKKITVGISQIVYKGFVQ